MNNDEQIIVAVSGGFDPIHPGHVRLFKDARALGDKLIVILNNDNWLMKKKRFTFMKETERKEVLEAIKYVDEVYLTHHKKNPEDMSVAEELSHLKPNIFANGGDRTKENVPEVKVCEKIGCKMVYNVGKGGKIQSSSELVDKAAKAAPRKINVNIKKR
ncbi:MAG: adenylyltransferase/cytidyltransferase family protein [Candidatus Doudnabacteria bacterium]|nr:adenylyltransferase/cytidyltransferase family protein [Candidatus Doudnabacteria bacterium]